MYRVTKTLVSALTGVALLAPVASFARSENAPPKRSDMATTTSASTTPSHGQGWALGPEMNPGQAAKTACIALKQSLGAGSVGPEVRRLQEMLSEDPDSEYGAGVTGYFGPLTKRAVEKLQMKYEIASSTATGLGRVGPMTRALLHRRCGLGLGGGNAGGTSAEHKMAVVIGAIEAASSTSITVKGSRTNVLYTVHFNASTTIRVAATSTPGTRSGTTADLVVGSSVTAEGTLQSDQSILAGRITVQRPKRQ
jgi:peptidoglycan hydrolase-like protein with peptidoglycan-binding domain